MKIRFAIFVLLIIYYNATSFCYHQNQIHCIKQVSIPKAGTHLGAKLIRLLTAKKHVSVIDHSDKQKDILFRPPLRYVTKQLKLLKASQFWISHLCHSKEYVDILEEARCKTIFFYRDPRDRVVSLAYYLTTGNQAKMDWPEAQKLSFDDLILDIIVRGSVCGQGSPFTGGVAALYSLYQPWLKEPGVLCLRFEDLVGSRGGGSDELQFATITTVARYLGVRKQQSIIKRIAQNLFGLTGTFREGTIGSWKKHFTQQHVDAFKAVAGDVLIQWGYEKDYNWGLDR